MLAVVSDPTSSTNFTSAELLAQSNKLVPALEGIFLDAIITTKTAVEFSQIEIFKLSSPTDLQPVRSRRATLGIPNTGVVLHMSAQGDVLSVLRSAIEYGLIATTMEDGWNFEAVQMFPVYYPVEVIYDLRKNQQIDADFFASTAIAVHARVFNTIDASQVTNINFNGTTGAFSYRLYVPNLIQYEAARNMTLQLQDPTVASLVDVSLNGTTFSTLNTDSVDETEIHGGSDSSGEMLSSSHRVLLLALAVGLALCFLPAFAFFVYNRRRERQKLRMTTGYRDKFTHASENSSHLRPVSVRLANTLLEGKSRHYYPASVAMTNETEYVAPTSSPVKAIPSVSLTRQAMRTMQQNSFRNLVTEREQTPPPSPDGYRDPVAAPTLTAKSPSSQQDYIQITDPNYAPVDGEYVQTGFSFESAKKDYIHLDDSLDKWGLDSHVPTEIAPQAKRSKKLWRRKSKPGVKSTQMDPLGLSNWSSYKPESQGIHAEGLNSSSVDQEFTVATESLLSLGSTDPIDPTSQTDTLKSTPHSV